MAKSSTDASYKIKLLILYDILKRETDEDHFLSTNEIIKKLKERGVSCDRRILYSDIEALNSFGYEVETVRGKSNSYHVLDNSDFDSVELKILMDAVQAAKFITKERTQTLTNKIAQLGGIYTEELLKKTIKSINLRKTEIKSIYYDINTIFEAISNRKKITFKYTDYSPEGTIVYRKEGGLYTYTPVELVVFDEYYYLIAKSDTHKDLTVFRVDRMRDVKMIDEPAASITEDFSEARNTALTMYIGKEEKVDIYFTEIVASRVFDKLGKGTVTKVDDTWYKITKKVCISRDFYAWCASLGKDLKLKASKATMQEYKDMLNEALSNIE